MLLKLRALLGVTGLVGPATVLAGMLIAFSAMATWLREDALNDCNAQWELKLAKANVKLTTELAERTAKLTALQEKLRLAQDAQEAAQVEHSKLLEKQREQIPLSEACMVCRIPNEHLWVRRNSENPRGGTEGGPEAEGRGVVAPRSEKAALP